MFDLTSGEVVIGGEHIGVGYTKSRFLTSALCTQVIRENIITYSQYILSPQRINNEFFSVFLSFKPGGRLEFISLSILSGLPPPAWENWAKDIEIQRKILNDKWLSDQIGYPPYKYDWGEIVSQFDPRSGTSTITIRYFE